MRRAALAALAALVLALAAGCDPKDADPGDEPGPDAATGDGDGDGDNGAVPASPDALFAYLSAGDYLALEAGFEAESRVHPSAGPHGSGGVRTYLDPLLAASLAAGDAAHPAGAAAIKELYASDGQTVGGWAVMVKTSAESAASSWYFYEVFSTTDGSRPIEGAGLSTCTGCHAAGADFVRVGYPLQ